MDNKRNDNGIKDILDKISSQPDSVTEKGGDGVLEFEFKGESSGGLVFEYGDVAEKVSTDEPEAASAKKPEPEPEPEPEEEQEEFTIPDAFVVSEKYNTPASEDTASRIWTTYVPRFTEISEKYRMVDDRRPPKRVFEDEEADEVKVLVKVADKPEPTEQTPSGVDPTAELDGEVDSVVVHSATPTKDEDAETLSVYKFSEEEAAAPEAPRERTVDDEREDIRRLIVGEEPEPDPVPEPDPAPVEEEIVAEEPTPEQKPQNYMIPDPTGGSLSVVDYAKKRHQKQYVPIAPEGASDEPIESPKKLSGEFTHQIQRDSFIDKFLDSLMSVRIRFFVSLAFLAVLLVYESLAAFGVIPSTVISTSHVTGALAIFDLLFVGCLFVLALPETVRAFRYLVKGKPTPELSLTAAFIVMIAYSLTVSLSGFDSYPLYGVLFGLLSLATVGSAYYRTTADFTAFKLISQNKEKRILDKKMTRTLPDENLALDGLIDEYKSRTTRIFRAGFITDFFKRTGEVAEDKTLPVTVIAVSFGVALVTGGVAFFLLEGLASAISAFTLVFLLGVPAFTVLSHKYSYFAAQNYALSEESTVVGESSYYDFSDVDVIAFEDTEIFGPDDVNLKRFMLYGDRDSMEKAMRQMCSLFSVVGGPLAYIFANALDTRMRHNPASDAVIENDGLSGNVGGHKISAGTEEYMHRHGIAIPEGAAKSEGGIDTTKIMYASEDGEIYAKFYIRYSFSEEFTMLLPTLKEEGIVPLIYTRDPNVSNELLRTLSAGSDCMRVMKRLVPGSDEDKLYRRVSAGIVTNGDKINAINIVLLTKKYKKFGERLSASGLYAMIGGLVGGIVLSLAGVTLPSLALGVWQLLWCLVLRFAGSRNFMQPKPDGKSSGN